ncbi:hypothetical protein FKM82_030913 [Ascaphus truei]
MRTRCLAHLKINAISELLIRRSRDYYWVIHIVKEQLNSPLIPTTDCSATQAGDYQRSVSNKFLYQYVLLNPVYLRVLGSN